MNLGVDPRHADQMVRGVVNLPNGSGRYGARRGVRPRRQGRRGQGRRRRRGRRRGSGREGQWRQYRLRPLHRHARPDAAGRPPRQGAGPARPDAEPQGRHRDHGHHQRGQGRQGRFGRVPRRKGRHRPGRGRQGLVHARTSWSRTSRRSPTRCRSRSRPAPRATSSTGWRFPRPWVRASRSSRRRCSRANRCAARARYAAFDAASSDSGRRQWRLAKPAGSVK